MRLKFVNTRLKLWLPRGRIQIAQGRPKYKDVLLLSTWTELLKAWLALTIG